MTYTDRENIREVPPTIVHTGLYFVSASLPGKPWQGTRLSSLLLWIFLPSLVLLLWDSGWPLSPQHSVGLSLQYPLCFSAKWSWWCHRTICPQTPQSQHLLSWYKINSQKRHWKCRKVQTVTGKVTTLPHVDTELCFDGTVQSLLICLP